MARRYIWDDWFALKRFTLTKGLHYMCSQSSICQQIRDAASDRKISVSISEGRDAAGRDEVRVDVKYKENGSGVLARADDSNGASP
jgi:hypothetical protein